MPSQFFGLNIGASALSAFQTSVNTAANNVANVQTKGYTRQTANLSATDPIRVYTRYGSVGTGVEVTSVTQERNLYYDEKYWQSNSSRGFFEQKLYYVDQVQTIFRDDEQSQKGFSSIFSQMFKDLDTLKTQGEVKAVRNQFIHQAQSLCTYFNALSKSLTEIRRIPTKRSRLLWIISIPLQRKFRCSTSRLIILKYAEGMQMSCATNARI